MARSNKHASAEHHGRERCGRFHEWVVLCVLPPFSLFRRCGIPHKGSPMMPHHTLTGHANLCPVQVDGNR